MKAGRQNTLDQMCELITQCYNHPCIAVWGLSNEITAASAVNDIKFQQFLPARPYQRSSEETVSFLRP